MLRFVAFGWLIRAVVVIFLLLNLSLGALYFRLIYQGKPVYFHSLAFTLSKDSKLVVSELCINYDRERDALVFKVEENGALIYSNNKTLAKVNQLSITWLRDGWHLPFKIQAHRAEIYANNYVSQKRIDSSRQQTNFLNSIEVVLNEVSRADLIYLASLDIAQSILMVGDIKHDFNAKASLDHNQLSAELNLDHKTLLNLSVVNQDLIESKLVVNFLPIDVVTAFLPENYRKEYFARTRSISGEMLYVIHPVTGKYVWAGKLAAEMKDADGKLAQKINYKIVTDRNLEKIDLSQFDFTYNNAKLSAVGVLKAKQKFFTSSYQAVADVSLDNFLIDDLKLFWPAQVIPEVRNWLVGAMSAGIVDRGSCQIHIDDIGHIHKEDINAQLNFHDINLNYYQEHKILNKLAGQASFDGEKVLINIDSGYVEQGKIEKASVEIIYSDKQIPLIINVATKGQAKDYLGFIDAVTLELIKDRGLDLPNISGDLSGKVYLNIPLSKDITLDNFVLDVNAKLDQVRVRYKNQVDIANGDFALVINNRNVSVGGAAQVNNNPAKIEWISNIDDQLLENFEHKLTAHLVLAPNSFIEQITQNYMFIKDGKADLELDYVSSKQQETIDMKIDLSRAQYSLPIINLNKEDDGVSQFMMSLVSQNKSADEQDYIGDSWVSKHLELTAGDKKLIDADLKINYDFNALENFNGHFLYQENDFVINYADSGAERLLKLQGTKIDLSKAEIMQMLRQRAGSDSRYEREFVTIDLKKVNMPRNIDFHKVRGNFECGGGGCNSGEMGLEVSDNAKASIKLVKNDGLRVWTIESEDAASFLKATNIYDNIRHGKLKLTLSEVSASKTQITPVYVGELEIRDFTATKTPILAKLISFSSFRGILSILQSYRAIPFEKMKANFVLANDVVRINNSYITGDYLTLTLNGIVDFEQDYLNLYGKVVPPVYGVNYMLSLIPFIGHKLAGEDGRKGLIAANYTISGPINDAKSFVNPLGLFVPEFLSTDLVELLVP